MCAICVAILDGGEDPRLRQGFSVLERPHDERFDQILTLLNGLLVGIAMRQISGKLWDGDDVCLIFIGLLNDH